MRILGFRDHSDFFVFRLYNYNEDIIKSIRTIMEIAHSGYVLDYDFEVSKIKNVGHDNYFDSLKETVELLKFDLKTFGKDYYGREEEIIKAINTICSFYGWKTI